MIKKSDAIKNPMLLFKSFSLVAMSLLLVNTIGYIYALASYEHIYQGELRDSVEFSIDYPLRIIIPLIVFVVGYFAIRSKDSWTKLFYGSVFTAVYVWLQLLFTAFSAFFFASSTNYFAYDTFQAAAPQVLPLILLAGLALLLRRKAAPPSGTNRLLRALLISSASVVLGGLLVLFVLRLAINPMFEVFTGSFGLSALLSLLYPVIASVVFVSGYAILNSVQQKTVRLYLSFLVTSIFTVTFLLPSSAYFYWQWSWEWAASMPVVAFVLAILIAAGLIYEIRKATIPIKKRKK